MQEKERDVLRLYSQNVNGFTLDRRGGQFGDLCKVLQEVQADVYCGQEHNLDVLKPQVKSILFDTTRQYWQRSRMILGTTPLDCKTMYKPGGTLMMTVAHTTGRITEQHTDKWGRWVSQTMQGGESKNHNSISISGRNRCRTSRTNNCRCTTAHPFVANHGQHTLTESSLSEGFNKIPQDVQATRIRTHSSGRL